MHLSFRRRTGAANVAHATSARKGSQGGSGFGGQCRDNPARKGGGVRSKSCVPGELEGLWASSSSVGGGGSRRGSSKR